MKVLHKFTIVTKDFYKIIDLFTCCYWAMGNTRLPPIFRDLAWHHQERRNFPMKSLLFLRINNFNLKLSKCFPYTFGSSQDYFLIRKVYEESFEYHFHQFPFGLKSKFEILLCIMLSVTGNNSHFCFLDVSTF